MIIASGFFFQGACTLFYICFCVFLFCILPQDLRKSRIIFVVDGSRDDEGFLEIDVDGSRDRNFRGGLVIGGSRRETIVSQF